MSCMLFLKKERSAIIRANSVEVQYNFIGSKVELNFSKRRSNDMSEGSNP